MSPVHSVHQTPNHTPTAPAPGTRNLTSSAGRVLGLSVGLWDGWCDLYRQLPGRRAAELPQRPSGGIRPEITDRSSRSDTVVVQMGCPDGSDLKNTAS